MFGRYEVQCGVGAEQSRAEVKTKKVGRSKSRHKYREKKRRESKRAEEKKFITISNPFLIGREKSDKLIKQR